MTVHLLLWNDDLATGGVVGVRDRMVKETNCANHTANFLHLGVVHIRRVAVNLVSSQSNHSIYIRQGYLLALGHIVATSHAHHLAVLKHNLVHRLVQHVGAAVDAGEAGKALGQFTQPVQRVEVRRFAVAGQRVAVEADALYGLGVWLLLVVVVTVKGQRVAREVRGVLIQAKLLVHLRVEKEIKMC
jgi:hypothetical protein